MKEELYIISTEGVRTAIDLSTPSGITLEYKSQLFGDLSKITCSRSYTFKLPMTVRNRRAFSSVEDARTEQTAARRKYRCEFVQNGIPLFTDANLYIDTASQTTYNAVMTFDIVSGFEALQDDDVSLRRLCEDAPLIVRWGGGLSPMPTPSKWHNDRPYTLPYRASYYREASGGNVWCLQAPTIPAAEVDGYKWNELTHVFNPLRVASLCGVPAVPVYYLVQKINERYGTRFELGVPYGGQECYDNEQNRYNNNGYPDLINRGCVPLVKTGLTDEQLEERAATLSSLAIIRFWYESASSTHKFDDAWEDEGTDDLYDNGYVVGFNFVNGVHPLYVGSANPWRGEADPTRIYYDWTFFTLPNARVEKYIIDGKLSVVFTDRWIRYKNGNIDKNNCKDGDGKPKEMPKFLIYRRYESDTYKDNAPVIKVEDVESVEGRENGSVGGVPTPGDTTTHYVYPVYEFNFREADGFSPIEVDDAVEGKYGRSTNAFPFFFGFSEEPYRIMSQSPVTITPSGNITDNYALGYETDLYTCLPDISCLTFMKTLFYLMGGFPVSVKGSIKLMRYGELYDNIRSGKARDWSHKLLAPIEMPATKTAYRVSSWAQCNWYLLKNDDLNKDKEKEADKHEDVYEDGFMRIDVDDTTLEAERTVIQYSWYGPWLRCGANPSQFTGRDMKYCEIDPKDDSVKLCEAKPALALIVPAPEGYFEYVGADRVMDATGNDDTTRADGTSLPRPGAVATLTPNGQYRMYMEVMNPCKGPLSEDYAAMQRILEHPLIITEKLWLNEFDLLGLNFAVPVYLAKHNAYFAIVSIKRDSKGVCTAELIKLP